VVQIRSPQPRLITLIRRDRRFLICAEFWGKGMRWCLFDVYLCKRLREDSRRY